MRCYADRTNRPARWVNCRDSLQPLHIKSVPAELVPRYAAGLAGSDGICRSADYSLGRRYLGVSVGAEADSLFSSYRERVLEHVFVGEVLRELWLRGLFQVEVLRAEVDGAGYDIVLESQSVVRHIQLKAARTGGRRGSVGVNVKLASKPSGCVVWFYFSPDTLSLGPFFWLGNEPGAPLLLSDLGLKLGRHTKADSTGHKADRPSIRDVPRSKFTRVGTVPELVARLFDMHRPDGKVVV